MREECIIAGRDVDLVEDSTIRAKIAEQSRSGDEQPSLKQYVDRVKE